MVASSKSTGIAVGSLRPSLSIDGTSQMGTSTQGMPSLRRRCCVLLAKRWLNIGSQLLGWQLRAMTCGILLGDKLLD